MNNHTVIGIDLAKTVFQVCVMKNGKLASNKKVKRASLHSLMANQPPSTVAMEACYSSHYWAREFERYGHAVKLIPAQYVKPFTRGNKTDANDAVAIIEASQRPNLRFVPIRHSKPASHSRAVSS
jgi:transposase